MSTAIYFCDYPLQCTPQDELEMLQYRLAELEVTDIRNISVTIEPPFVGFRSAQKYDILFFDWGGMSVGNSMMESFCRYILKEAEDYPNKVYVMVSRFTAAAMQDAMGSMSSKLPNVFLTLEDFTDYYKRVWKQ